MTREEYIDFEFNRIAFCYSQKCSTCPMVMNDGVCSFNMYKCSKKEMLANITEERFALIKNYRQSDINWAEIPVDTPIYVRNSESHAWKPCHFAKYEEGNVYSWYDGGTSFSTTLTRCWNYAKLADKYED